MGNLSQQTETKKTAAKTAEQGSSVVSQALDTAQELSKNLAALVLPSVKPPAPAPVTKPEKAPTASSAASAEKDPAPGILSRLGTALKDGGTWLKEQGEKAAGWAVEKAHQFKNCRSFGEFCSVAGCCVKEIFQGVRDFVVSAASGAIASMKEIFKADRNPITQMLTKAAEAFRNKQEEKKKRCEFYNELRRKKREEALACEAGDDCDVADLAPRFADEKMVGDLKLAVLFNKVSSQHMVDVRRFLADYERENHKKKSVES